MQLSKDKKAKINVQDAKWKTIRSQIYPAVLSNFSVIREAAQSIDVPELIGREDEIWTPMLTMACAIDKETLLPFVIDLAQQSHKQRQREKESDEHGTVLRVVHGIMNEEDKCFVPAKEIFEELGNDEDFEWLTSSQWRYKRNKWLNNLLNHMGLWEGAAIGRNHALGKVKGYDILRKDVLSAADRYGVDLEAL